MNVEVSPRRPAMSRVQLALNVNNLDESISFYSRLFNTAPAKIRDGYANFAVAEPPLKLVLLENPGHGGSLNHLGVEVEDTDRVDAEQTRLAAAGLASVDERGTSCCYAKQDKFWVEGTPNGGEWEGSTLLAASASFGCGPADNASVNNATSASCCTSADDQTSSDEPSSARAASPAFLS